MEKVPDAPHAPERGAGDGPDGTEPRNEPIMEAPVSGSITAAQAASWNPGQGDRSFGYGSAEEPSAAQSQVATGQGDMTEDTP